LRDDQLLQGLALAGAGADDEGQQTTRPPKLAPVEDELRRVLRGGRQCQHRARQAAGGQGIHGGDRFMVQGLCRRRPAPQAGCYGFGSMK